MSGPRHGLRFYALVAGFGCISLAAFVQGVLPMLEPETRTDKMTKVVRTDIGELKWIEHRASDDTPLERLGRAVCTREGCWYCHSQYVRPVTGETRRWGPITQAGEFAFDIAHMFSTRRIGPNRFRVGLKDSDACHLAHFWEPRMLSPDSIMPRFSALFDGPYTAKVVPCPLIYAFAAQAASSGGPLQGCRSWSRSAWARSRRCWQWEVWVCGFAVQAQCRTHSPSMRVFSRPRSRCRAPTGAYSVCAPPAVSSCCSG